MRGRVAFALALMPFVIPVAGLADGWSIHDLGAVPTRAECMARAKTTISAYMFQNGGGETFAEAWTVYAYDLTPGDQDAVIMCPIVAGGAANAFVHVFGEADNAQRVFTGDELKRIWFNE